jgi:hypothetical protein
MAKLINRKCTGGLDVHMRLGFYYSMQLGYLALDSNAETTATEGL